MEAERYVLPFETYADASIHPDAKYVLDINERATLLTRRVESLNHVGQLLWPRESVSASALPLSAYEYCNLIQDAFLMRIVSVVDCCALLLAEVLELNIPPREVKLSRIQKLYPEHSCVSALDRLSRQQKELRTERNFRIHAGEEKHFTDDDTTFKIASFWAGHGNPMTGEDQHGRAINIDRSFRVAIGQLRVKFNEGSRMLVASLDGFYDQLNEEFEGRFKEKCRALGSYMGKTRRAQN